MPAYFESLINEMQRYLPQTQIIRSVYFGGGTPSYFPVQLLVRIINFIKEHFLISKATEITIEINPGTLSVDDLLFLKEAGFNRLSLGLQAGQDRILQTIGRIHTWADFHAIYELAREVGYHNIGIDLISGLPNQSMEDWQETLQRVVDLNPEHISAYGLQLEPKTRLAQLIELKSLQLPNEDTSTAMVYYTMGFLRQHGYEHYEISNFSRPGFHSIHNLGYWNGRDYLGFGAGAASTYQQERWVNHKEPHIYIQAIRNSQSLIASSETIGPVVKLTETLMLGLRMRAGVSLTDFQKHFQVDLINKIQSGLAVFIEQKLIQIENDRLVLTDEGVLISNYVIANILGLLIDSESIG